MFDTLSERLGGIFDGLTGRGALSEKDVNAALREIRVALLEADVALPVVKDFIDSVRARAVGEEVIRSVKPGQQVIKIVYDGLVEMLGGEEADTSLRIDSPPAIIMMAGLQGSGKTTTTGKLAKRLSEKERKRVLLASLDTRRPAAMEQLAILADQCNENVSALPIIQGQLPADIARRALNAAKISGYDVLILDTAGRTTIDEQMMNEVAEIAQIANPSETLLVADALTGQDAVETASRFHARLPLTGLVLTRMDGDGRGGAALSMRAVTGRPIKLMGTGEKMDALEVFDAGRIASSILGQGDVVGLVEKAAEVIDQQEAEKMAAKMMKGKFTLEDMAEQFKQIRKMGDVKGLMGMIPGAAKMKDKIAAANIDDKTIARQEAIIRSMTMEERQKPKLLNGSRRRRIATGSGTSVQDVNRVLKQFKQMSQMMKKAGKMGKRGMMPGMPPGMMTPGGPPMR